jgi:hypothetical protein
MVRIVRTGKIIQKFSKDGKLLSGASFKTVEDAKRLEKKYNEYIKKGKTFHVGMKLM